MYIQEYPLKWTIRHRRSAIDFDGQTTMSLNVFHYLMQFLCSPYKADYLIPRSSAHHPISVYPSGGGAGKGSILP